MLEPNQLRENLDKEDREIQSINSNDQSVSLQQGNWNREEQIKENQKAIKYFEKQIEEINMMTKEQRKDGEEFEKLLLDLIEKIDFNGDKVTVVLIDTNVLGQIVSPTDNESREHLYQIYNRGGTLVTSDICDYEIRRNLIFIQLDRKITNKFKDLSLKSLQNLNNLRTDSYVEFITTDSDTLQKASTIWAKTQILGIPLTHREKLDVDSILCAHWEILSEENPGRRVIVATTNIRHLGNFVEAQQWLNIKI